MDTFPPFTPNNFPYDKVGTPGLEKRKKIEVFTNPRDFWDRLRDVLEGKDSDQDSIPGEE